MTVVIRGRMIPGLTAATTCDYETNSIISNLTQSMTNYGFQLLLWNCCCHFCKRALRYHRIGYLNRKWAWYHNDAHMVSCEIMGWSYCPKLRSHLAVKLANQQALFYCGALICLQHKEQSHLNSLTADQQLALSTSFEITQCPRQFELVCTRKLCLTWRKSYC